MNHICTWLCADEKGEESIFPQTGMLSSSQRHQDIYWRCVLVFFITSRRFNEHQKHVLFTNVKKLPALDGMNTEIILSSLEVEVVFTDFKYKTPRGYYGQFQNQFYEFSILEHISKTNTNLRDNYLILDSDCIFISAADKLFNAAMPGGFISFEDDVAADYVINGLSRNDMKTIYAELLNKPVAELPSYHLGEFLLSSVENIGKIFTDFIQLWPQLLDRNMAGLKKLNEEAHTLSFLYFKNGLKAEKDNPFMKRIWTNPLFYRNVHASDLKLCIWHLPSEKTFGIRRLYNYFIKQSRGYRKQISHEDYMRLIKKSLGIPRLSILRRMEYYSQSFYRAMKKRFPA